MTGVGKIKEEVSNEGTTMRKMRKGGWRDEDGGGGCGNGRGVQDRNGQRERGLSKTRKEWMKREE